MTPRFLLASLAVHAALFTVAPANRPAEAADPPVVVTLAFDEIVVAEDAVAADVAEAPAPPAPAPPLPSAPPAMASVVAEAEVPVAPPPPVVRAPEPPPAAEPPQVPEPPRPAEAPVVEVPAPDAAAPAPLSRAVVAESPRAVEPPPAVEPPLAVEPPMPAGVAGSNGRGGPIRGAARAGMGGSTTPEAHEAYRAAIQARLQGALVYPPAARRLEIQGRARVAFVVLATGDVENVRVVESAGHRLLDDAAVALIHRVAPLPPPPFDLGPAGRVSFVVPVRYALR